MRAWTVLLVLAAGCSVLPGTGVDAGAEPAWPACAQDDAWDGLAAEDGGVVPAGCTQGAGDILVLNDNGELFRFDPATLAFASAGTPACGSGVEAFAMARDREGTPWLLFEDGALFRVTSATGCSATGWTPGTQGLERFALAFGTDPGGRDVLLVAGDTHAEHGQRPARLARVDPRDWTVEGVCMLPSAPELTATGDGRAWAYFALDTPPTLRPLSPATGMLGRPRELPELGGEVTHWAAAVHGGYVYVFLRRTTDFSTGVYRVDPRAASPSAVRVVPHSTTLSIVGAAVSPCAPLR